MTSKIEIGKFPILSVRAGNFSTYEDQFLKEICMTSGFAGEQIINKKEKSIRFPARPHQNDFLFNEDTGLATHPKYRRDTTGYTVTTASQPLPVPSTPANLIGSPMTTRSQTKMTITGTTPAAINIAAQAAATATAKAAAAVNQYDADYFDLPLTDKATDLLEKHIDAYEKELREAIQSDNDLLQFLHATHSADSKISIEASANYAPYPPNCFSKSFKFWNLSREIHETGSGAVKLARTKATFQLKQGDMRHEHFMDAITKAQRNLNSDFATLVDMPGHELHGQYVINVNHLMSLVYLNGVDQKFFAWQLNKTLETHGDGKIDDTAALLRTFHAYQVARDLTDPAQTRDKGTRALAATATATDAPFTRPDADHGCSVCFDMGFTKKAQNHLLADCPCNKKSSAFDATKLKSATEFAASHFKKTKKPAADTAAPVAHAAVATAVAATAEPVGAADSLYSTQRFRALQAVLHSCPANTVARVNAAADIAAYIEANGVDETAPTNA